MLLSSLEFTFSKDRNLTIHVAGVSGKKHPPLLMQDVSDLRNNLPECRPPIIYMSFVQEASCMVIFP